MVNSSPDPNFSIFNFNESIDLDLSNIDENSLGHLSIGSDSISVGIQNPSDSANNQKIDDFFNNIIIQTQNIDPVENELLDKNKQILRDIFYFTKEGVNGYFEHITHIKDPDKLKQLKTEDLALVDENNNIQGSKELHEAVKSCKEIEIKRPQDTIPHKIENYTFKELNNEQLKSILSAVKIYAVVLEIFQNLQKSEAVVKNNNVEKQDGHTILITRKEHTDSTQKVRNVFLVFGNEKFLARIERMLQRQMEQAATHANHIKEERIKEEEKKYIDTKHRIIRKEIERFDILMQKIRFDTLKRDIIPPGVFLRSSIILRGDKRES